MSVGNTVQEWVGLVGADLGDVCDLDWLAQMIDGIDGIERIMVASMGGAWFQGLGIITSSRPNDGDVEATNRGDDDLSESKGRFCLILAERVPEVADRIIPLVRVAITTRYL